MYRKSTKLSTMLNKRLEFWHNTRVEERDELGQMPVGEEKLLELYGCIIPQTGSLMNGRTGDTTLSRTTHKVVIRYRKDITPDMWVMFEGKRYNILYILDPYSNHERLEIFCEVLL